MKASRISTVLLVVAALLCLGVATGQSEGGKSELDQQIARALQSNPKVLLAIAKLRQAEAHYKEVRLEITQAVVRSHHARASLEARARQLEHRMRETHELLEQGMTGRSDYLQAEADWIGVKNELALLDLEMKSLVGEDGAASVETVAPATDAPRTRKRPEISVHLAEVLATQVRADFQDTPILQFCQDLTARVQGQTEAPFTIVINPMALESIGLYPEETRVTFEAGGLPLADLLLAVADMSEFCFVVRDYGILVTSYQQAQTMVAPTIPYDIPLRDG